MRMRTIKPGYFLNHKLAELHPLTRLLYAGLWCVADRNGRLENTPKRLKIQILPYDSHDITEALESLEDAGFITQYSAGGMELIEIKNFIRHQYISAREKEAKVTLPAPTDGHAEAAVEDTAEPVSPESDNRANQIIEIWNEMAEKNGLKAACTDTDRKAARVLAMVPDAAQIVKAINAVATSPFLRGEGEKGWAASLSWLSKRENLDKVLAGQYADHKQTEKKKPPLDYMRDKKTATYVGVCKNCNTEHKIRENPGCGDIIRRPCQCADSVKLSIVLEDDKCSAGQQT